MADASLFPNAVATGRAAARLVANAWPRRMQSAARRATACSFLAHAMCAFALVVDGVWQPAILYPPPQGPSSLPQAASARQQLLVEYDAPVPVSDNATAEFPHEPKSAPPAEGELEAAVTAQPRSIPPTPLGTLPTQVNAIDDDAVAEAIGHPTEELPQAVADSRSTPSEFAQPTESLPRQDVARDLQSQVESLASAAAAALQGALVNAEPLGETNPEPVYPPEALAKRLAGLVLIRALIDERGRVVRADVYQTSGHSQLDQAALEAVRRWRFTPARLDGEPASCELAIPVRFVIPQ